MHTTKITEIGSIVPEFEEEFLLVLFGPAATPELRDICVIHEDSDSPKNVLKPNGTMTIGKQVYHITKVGTEANTNYEELGHISIYFREGENEVLPGAIVVEPQVFPAIAVGDMISFS